MPCKSIALVVDSADQDARPIAACGSLAAHLGAHLTGLYCDLDAYVPPYQRPTAGADQSDDGENDATAAGRVFEQCCGAINLASSDWRVVKGTPPDVLTRYAAAADLLCMTLPAGKKPLPGRLLDPATPATLALLSGRPVLGLPANWGRSPVGGNILIGWQGSQEAMHAVTAALPLLEVAERVRVVTIDPSIDYKGWEESPGDDIMTYLRRHGVEAERRTLEGGGQSIADSLLTSADAMDADLLILGAYGHSRLREFVLGGATRGVLHDIRRPVLLAH
ncbi:universal stress protein [Salinisphaera orenii]|uniref:universal stress protein n=1 Tax=Salinisphaera orenii TaxID=856731 RepID=UPI000DBE5272